MKALENCDKLRKHLKPGKQGIAAKHREILIESAKHRVTRSLDFEHAVSGMLPSKKRWDYVIETNTLPGQANAIEVHQYDESALTQKREGTKALIATCCRGADSAIDAWIVILEGASPRADILARFKARTGIHVVGRNLKISDLKVTK